ncbi:hypothetical protein RclHR1_01520015 [Rhizophagus clarus]|uniref:BTB domain-containing protein n=1 Tax=Rhizophagus clarus TaxID=94130 RepID=A0A2Z6QEL6_9GLOM|nr:hypothetical protein RclHR1_01520015 [Rhizophagus clarus]GES78720.1 hypothetical protein GLOIN_2v1545431 [Rhizophagus clarus]
MMVQNNSSPRGRSLERDFKKLIGDERFHDIHLKCSDGKTIRGCKAILATRSDVFNSSIFNESTKGNNLLSFNDIDSIAMKVVLEFLYTSKVEGLNVNNIVEVYYASIYFDLIDLQDHIIELMKRLSMNKDVNVGKKLLSECVKKFSIEVDNKMSQVLINWVAKNKLENCENDSLSLEGLRYLLEKTFDSQIPFATSEFNVWEYTFVKAIKEVIQNNKTLVKEILDKNSFSTCRPQEIEEIKSHLTPLINYINLKRMNGEEIEQRIEPFNIYPTEELKKGYSSILNGRGLGFIRGVPIFKWKNNKHNGSVFKISPAGGFIVEANGQPKSILGDLIFEGKGVYEWRFLIEKLCKTIYIGICEVNVDLSKGDQGYHGWVLGSDGYVYHEKNYTWYDARLKEWDNVTVHLDMKNKTCAFSVNNIKKQIVSEWNIPSQVCAVASLGHGSKLRIKSIKS